MKSRSKLGIEEKDINNKDSNSEILFKNTSNSKNRGNEGQSFDKLVPKPPDGKRTRKTNTRKNVTNRKQNDDNESTLKERAGRKIESNSSQRKLQFNDNVSSHLYNNDNTHNKETKEEKEKQNLFHLSLNDSTFSLIDNTVDYFEMSSGLIVNKRRPSYDMHISIDESSEMNQSVAFIKNQIFDQNNEWKVEATSPGRYVTNENKVNEGKSLGNSVNKSQPSGAHEPEWSSCRVEFLYNEVIGLICKPCFSVSCEHYKIISGVVTQTTNNNNFQDHLQEKDNLHDGENNKNKTTSRNFLEYMNCVLNDLLIPKHDVRIVQISERFVYRYEDADIYFHDVVLELTGYIATSFWEYEYSKLTNKPSVAVSKDTVAKNNFTVKKRRNSKADSLCYDSDYDDGSYLNSCVGNEASSYARRNSNTSLRAITPPLTCSSPSADQNENNNIPTNVTDNPFKLETVFEHSWSRNDVHENDKDSLDGEDKTKSNESLFSNLSDSLDNSTSSILEKGVRKEERVIAQAKHHSLPIQTNKVLSQNQNKANKTSEKSSKKGNKLQKSFDEEKKRPDDNLTTKELKEFARKELISQLKRDYNITNSNDPNLLNFADENNVELDSEDELQWFLQEKRKKLLNSELFSSDNSEVLPEDEEVRRINTQNLNIKKKSNENKDLKENMTYENKSTNTERIDNELNSPVEVLVLDDSIGSAVDSGLDSHTSISNSRSNDADNNNNNPKALKPYYFKSHPRNDDVQLIFTNFDERMSKRNSYLKTFDKYPKYIERNRPIYQQKYPKSSILLESINRITRTASLNANDSFKRGTRGYTFPRGRSANSKDIKHQRHNSARSQDIASHTTAAYGTQDKKYNILKSKSFQNQYGINYTQNSFPNISSSDELVVLGHHIYNRRRKP